MSTKTNVILISISIAAIIAAICLLFLIFKILEKKKKESITSSLGEKIKKERAARAATILTRVKTISKANPQFVALYTELSGIYDELSEKITFVTRRLGELELAKGKMNMKDFRVGQVKIESLLEGINILESRFNINSAKIVQQDEFMRSEFSFYSRNLRKVIGVYKQKRILLNRIAGEIDQLSQRIKSSENGFNMALNKADTRGASESLRLYSKQVIQLSSIINEGPTIQSYLYITIPKMIKELFASYQLKKTEVKGSLEHIDFKRTITDISKTFNTAKNSYLTLDLDNAKELIKNMLKSIKVVERLINYEIKSHNTFVANYEGAIFETKKVLTKYVAIRKRIKELKERGVNIPVDLNDVYATLRQKASAVDTAAVAFRESSLSTKIPYSSKLTRMKMLLLKIEEVVDSINDIQAIIWTINVEKSLLRNKLKRVEGALNEIVANTKKMNVDLTHKEKDEFDELSLELTEVSPKIMGDDIPKETLTAITNLVEKTTNFYQKVGGKLQIVEITNNMLTELAPQRALDDKLNYQLSLAESAFLQGKYDGALNAIITHIEEESKNVHRYFS